MTDWMTQADFSLSLISYKIIDFLFTFFKFFFLQNELNVTNFRCFLFVTRFHITRQSFSSD